MELDQQSYNATYTTTTTCHHSDGGRWWPELAGNSPHKTKTPKTGLDSREKEWMVTYMYTSNNDRSKDPERRTRKYTYLRSEMAAGGKSLMLSVHKKTRGRSCHSGLLWQQRSTRMEEEGWRSSLGWALAFESCVILVWVKKERPLGLLFDVVVAQEKKREEKVLVYCIWNLKPNFHFFYSLQPLQLSNNI